MKSPTDDRQHKPLLMSRRNLLMALPMMPLAMRSIAQQSTADPIAVSGLHNIGLRVTDIERSIEFYQGLFGAPIVARVGDTVSFLIGNGPQYFTLAPTRRGEDPNISHFGFSIPGADFYQLQSRLSEHGIGRTVESFYDSRRSPLYRAELTWFERLPGGDDTMLAEQQELLLADPNGVTVQLSDPSSCGAGTAPCTPEPAPSEGLIQLRELNHLTTFVANYQSTNDFYRRVFGLQNQAFQADFPLLGVGDTGQFLMFVGGTQPGEPEQPGRIDHVSFNMEDFSVDSVLQRLTDYGLSPRSEGEEGPLQHWVSMRMPERGGAPGGTPEVYFSDPDGIHLQLQHHTYCGGGGEFGSECSV